MKKSSEYSYDFADYRNGIPPRAMGSETEYTNDRNVEERVNLNYLGGLNHNLIKFVRPLYFVSTGRDISPSAVTSNGGEIYLDVYVLEYATPECTSPTELALHERAGEHIVCDTVARIGEAHGMQPKVYKRSGYAEVRVEGKKEPLLEELSVGHHESYTSRNVFSAMPAATREKDMAKNLQARQFADFLALRKLIDGVGMVANDHFSITQKPRVINYNSFNVNFAKTGKKPFQQKTSRLEVRSGEGNKSDWAVAFKTGLTSLVLRLIERNAYPNHLKLYDPNTVVTKLSKDPLAEVWLESGIRMKGADVLKGIVDTAYELCQQYDGFPDYEQQAYADFIKFYDDLHNISLKDHDVSALSDRIDWAARYAFFVRQGARYDTFTTSDLQQVQHDLVWDRIDDKDIAGRWFARFGHTALSVTVPEPPKTRAATRVKLVKQLYEAGNLDDVGWSTVTTKDGRLYTLHHPLSKEMELGQANQPPIFPAPVV